MVRFVSVVACLVAALVSAACSSTGGGAVPAGLASPDSFLKTPANVVVLEIFDMYCHHCQSAAPHVVKTYHMARSRMGSQVEFYGIAYGNTPMEAEQFRTKFNVPFPVIADRNLAISSRYGKFRPPLLIVLKKQGGRWVETFRSSNTHLKPEEILAKITS